MIRYALRIITQEMRVTKFGDLFFVQSISLLTKMTHKTTEAITQKKNDD